MKKFICLAIGCLVHLSFVFSQDEMVAGWTFPDNSLAADTGAAINLSQEIFTVGGTSAIELKNGFTTKAAQASGWNDGMETKAWVITMSSSGFSNLSISSRQQSGGTDPGPKYFKLQYSVDGGNGWEDIPGGDIIAENDWETSFVDQLPLPEACDDLDELSIRWLMASNEASGPGGNVQEIGKSKIDEIYIRGELINGIADHGETAVTVRPGASAKSLRIEARQVIQEIYISSLSGQALGSRPVKSKSIEIDLSAHRSSQLLLITIRYKNSPEYQTLKYFLP